MSRSFQLNKSSMYWQLSWQKSFRLVLQEFALIVFSINCRNVVMHEVQMFPADCSKRSSRSLISASNKFSVDPRIWKVMTKHLWRRYKCRVYFAQIHLYRTPPLKGAFKGPLCTPLLRAWFFLPQLGCFFKHPITPLKFFFLKNPPPFWVSWHGEWKFQNGALRITLREGHQFFAKLLREPKKGTAEKVMHFLKCGAERHQFKRRQRLFPRHRLLCMWWFVEGRHSRKNMYSQYIELATVE